MPWQWLYTVSLRLRTLFRRCQVERELDEKLRFTSNSGSTTKSPLAARGRRRDELPPRDGRHRTTQGGASRYAPHEYH
jgi:hypothetical protein